MADFRNLIVWQKAHAIAVEVHGAAGQIRGAQHTSLRSQLTRAAQSIPANIVEGASQESARDFTRFLGYALGSAAELEYHLILARDVRLLAPDDADAMMSRLIEVKKMLHGLRARVARRAVPSSTP